MLVLHVRANIVGVDSSKACGVKVHEIIKSLDDPINQTVHEKLAHVAPGIAWSNVVQVHTIVEIALLAHQSRWIGDQYADQRPGKLFDLQVRKQLLNDGDSIQFVAMQRRTYAENWSVLCAPGNNQGNANRFSDSVVDDV